MILAIPLEERMVYNMGKTERQMTIGSVPPDTMSNIPVIGLIPFPFSQVLSPFLRSKRQTEAHAFRTEILAAFQLQWHQLCEII
jgi:hypothetical protein